MDARKPVRPGPINIKTAHSSSGPLGRDPRVRRTLHVFATKGFLTNDPPRSTYRKRLTLDDVPWTCAVAAAAALCFPGH